MDKKPRKKDDPEYIKNYKKAFYAIEENRLKKNKRDLEYYYLHQEAILQKMRDKYHDAKSRRLCSESEIHYPDLQESTQDWQEKNDC
jgi:hypothetical protein